MPRWLTRGLSYPLVFAGIPAHALMSPGHGHASLSAGSVTDAEHDHTSPKVVATHVTLPISADSSATAVSRKRQRVSSGVSAVPVAVSGEDSTAPLRKKKRHSDHPRANTIGIASAQAQHTEDGTDGLAQSSTQEPSSSGAAGMSAEVEQSRKRRKRRGARRNSKQQIRGSGAEDAAATLDGSAAGGSSDAGSGDEDDAILASRAVAANGTAGAPAADSVSAMEVDEVSPDLHEAETTSAVEGSMVAAKRHRRRSGRVVVEPVEVQPVIDMVSAGTDDGNVASAPVDAGDHGEAHADKDQTDENEAARKARRKAERKARREQRLAARAASVVDDEQAVELDGQAVENADIEDATAVANMDDDGVAQQSSPVADPDVTMDDSSPKQAAQPSKRKQSKPKRHESATRSPEMHSVATLTEPVQQAPVPVTAGADALDEAVTASPKIKIKKSKKDPASSKVLLANAPDIAIQALDDLPHGAAKKLSKRESSTGGGGPHTASPPVRTSSTHSAAANGVSKSPQKSRSPPTTPGFRPVIAPITSSSSPSPVGSDDGGAGQAAADGSQPKGRKRKLNSSSSSSSSSSSDADDAEQGLHTEQGSVGASSKHSVGDTGVALNQVGAANDDAGSTSSGADSDSGDDAIEDENDDADETAEVTEADVPAPTSYAGFRGEHVCMFVWSLVSQCMWVAESV